jgi:hypothetical protein
VVRRYSSREITPIFQYDYISAVVQSTNANRTCPANETMLQHTLGILLVYACIRDHDRGVHVFVIVFKHKSKGGIMFRNAISLVMIASMLNLLAASCSDRGASVVGAAQSPNGEAEPIGLEGDHYTNDETIYCIAFDEAGYIIWIQIHESIAELGFSLSERQRAMLERHGVVVIDANDFNTGIDPGTAIDMAIAGADMILIATGKITWSCLKLCAGATNEEACILACMGKRPNSSGY